MSDHVTALTRQFETFKSRNREVPEEKWGIVRSVTQKKRIQKSGKDYVVDELGFKPGKPGNSIKMFIFSQDVIQRLWGSEHYNSQ